MRAKGSYLVTVVMPEDVTMILASPVDTAWAHAWLPIAPALVGGYRTTGLAVIRSFRQ